MRTMIYPQRSIHGYVHQARIGVLLEFGLETDFAERTPAFQALARDIALHVAAIGPVDVEDLLSQPFVKNPGVTVAELLADTAEQLREQLAVIRFVRWSTEHPEYKHVEPDPDGPPAPAVGLRLVR